MPSKKKPKSIEKGLHKAALATGTAYSQGRMVIADPTDWLAQVEGIYALLEKLPSIRTGGAYAEQWRSGMKRHYLTTIRNLLAQPPAGMEAAAKDIAERLAKV